MTIQEVLDRTTHFFETKGIETSRLDAELLLSEALRMKRIDLYLKHDSPLTEEELEKCRAVVKRRSTGEPVAYILGRKEFYGLSFLVNSHVLIPRPDSEVMVERCLEVIQKNFNSQDLKILDLGAGSGCLGLTVLKKVSRASLVAIEKSTSACEVLSQNAKDLELSQRTTIIALDIDDLDVVNPSVLEQSSFDIVLSNPPYIAEGDPLLQKEVKLFEPHLALFGGVNGLAKYPHWLKCALSFLRNKGFIFFEIGAGQATDVEELMKTQGLKEIEVIKDLAGHDRVLVAQLTL